MDIIVACEMTGIVSQAFAAKGHNVLSCDLMPSIGYANHFQGSIFDVPGINVPGSFDMLIAFPPCTFLCKAQIPLQWSPARQLATIQAEYFVRRLFDLPIPRIAIENPIGMLTRLWRSPDQIIYPWWFGSDYDKDICLWLKGLPPLMATCYSTKRKKVANHVNSRMSQARKSVIKSMFFPQVAEAMACQWS